MTGPPDQPEPVPSRPGIVAWLLVIAGFALPVLGGWWGIGAIGPHPSAGRLFASVGALALAVAVSLAVHLWGIVRAFYPADSGRWLAVSVLGFLGGVATLAAAILVLVVVLRD